MNLAAQVVVVALLIWSTGLWGQEIDLRPQNRLSSIGNEFGHSLAINDRFVVVGERFNDDASAIDNGIFESGAAHVFNAVTGVWLRKLLPLDAGEGFRFGTAVAIEGHLALVGAPGASVFHEGNTILNAGAVYLFDLRDGRQLKKIQSPTPQNGALFGEAVSLSVNQAAIGEPNGGGTPGEAPGAAYLCDIRQPGTTLTPNQILVTPDTAAADSEFGSALCVRGNIVVVGARFYGNARGDTWVYNVVGGATLESATSLPRFDAADDDEFGAAVLIEGEHLLVGAPGRTGGGAAYLYSLRDLTISAQKLDPGSEGAFQRFGASLAMCGTQALIGAPNFDSGKGTVYIFEPSTPGGVLQEKVRFDLDDTGPDFQAGRSLAATPSSFAVGISRQNTIEGAGVGVTRLFKNHGTAPLLKTIADGSLLSSFTDRLANSTPIPAIHPDGEVTFLDRSRGRGQFMMSNFTGSLNPMTGLGIELAFFDNARVIGLQPPLAQSPSRSLFQVKLSGPQQNNQALLMALDDGLLLPLLRRGDEISEIGAGVLIDRFQDLGQNWYDSSIYLGYDLRRGQGGINRGNDSGVFAMNQDGEFIASGNRGIRNREGELAPTGGIYGQFTGRVIAGPFLPDYSPGYFMFSAGFVRGPGASPRSGLAIFYDSTIYSAGYIAATGEEADGLPDILYQSLLGESTYGYYTTFRATLRKQPGTSARVASSNNEALFNDDEGVMLRKGDAPDSRFPNQKVARFLQFWSLAESDSVALVRLRGRGVNASNDLALVLISYSNDQPKFEIVVREGDAVPTSDGARIRAIQRVDIDPHTGTFVILASLTGDSTANQALFSGQLSRPDLDTEVYRRQTFLSLRKGTQHTGVDAKLRGMSLPVTTDRTGAGGKGIGKSVTRFGEVVVILDYSPGNRVLASGLSWLRGQL